METTIYLQSGLVVSGVRRTYDCVVVDFEGYDTYTFTYSLRTAYRYAYRFVRLIERGYAPRVALALCQGAWESPTLKTFKTWFSHEIHDKLTDEVVDLIPEGFEVEAAHLDSYSSHTKDCLYADWLLDGDRALTAYSEELNITVFELRHYCAVRAMTEDEVFA